MVGMDMNARAATQLSAERAAAGVKPARCGDCNARCAWVQSKRTGKWYLADALMGGPGKVIPQPQRPHFKTCGDKALHA